MATCIILSGALFGNLNGLYTDAVMDASPFEASTTSSAFSFMRMIGGAIVPVTARILGQIFSPHTPFIVGGGFVLGAIILIFLNRDYAFKPVEILEEKPETTTLKVKDFMVPDVIFIKPEATVKELLNLLTQHHISGVPVVDNQNKIVGMASDGDIIRYLNPKE